ncbi:UDP-N-acetylmuramoylalanyl-D-glutamyl-2,6-diaminopimelate--D-alanyl-D-alanyl ligase [gut metagenome]|uniref:UDP-MurNAc-pentapeptide synthetase n=1 Tax=gut metagenome TaxID=749906 RepID=J9DA52_9ZZZZ
MDIQTIYQRFKECQGVTTDSRNCPKGSLFIALKGENFNGNAFATKALEMGCRYAIIDEADYAQANDARYLLVDNTLLTLQQLANFHRKQLGTRIIGITGTNGKTTTKELLAAVLSTSYHILYTQGNLNNHIGVPLTLLKLKPQHELAVVEMGASHPGDIKELVEIAEPDFGLITNIGKAHLEGFGSLEGVIRTKGELFDFLRNQSHATIFVHHENPYLQKMTTGLSCIYYGEENGLYISGHVTGNSPFLSINWKTDTDDTIYSLDTQLIGAYNFANVLAAITVGRFFHIAPDRINRALQNYVPQNNRSQLKKTANNTLIIDAYNANPTSMRASIDNFYHMQADNKMLILGDMRELGTDSIAEHQAIIDYLKNCRFSNVILVGSQFAATQHTYPTYPDTSALIEVLKQNKPLMQTILIKGSNGIHLSNIIDYL